MAGWTTEKQKPLTAYCWQWQLKRILERIYLKITKLMFHHKSRGYFLCSVCIKLEILLMDHLSTGSYLE